MLTMFIFPIGKLRPGGSRERTPTPEHIEDKLGLEGV